MNQSFRRNTPRQALAAALLSSATTLGCAAEPDLPCPPTEPEVTGTALQAFCFVDPDVPVAGVAGGVVDEVIGDKTLLRCSGYVPSQNNPAPVTVFRYPLWIQNKEGLAVVCDQEGAWVYSSQKDSPLINSGAFSSSIPSLLPPLTVTLPLNKNSEILRGECAGQALLSGVVPDPFSKPESDLWERVNAHKKLNALCPEGAAIHVAQVDRGEDSHPRVGYEVSCLAQTNRHQEAVYDHDEKTFILYDYPSTPIQLPVIVKGDHEQAIACGKKAFLSLCTTQKPCNSSTLPSMEYVSRQTDHTASFSIPTAPRQYHPPHQRGRPDTGRFTTGPWYAECTENDTRFAIASGSCRGEEQWNGKCQMRGTLLRDREYPCRSLD